MAASQSGPDPTSDCNKFGHHHHPWSLPPFRRVLSFKLLSLTQAKLFLVLQRNTMEVLRKPKSFFFFFSLITCSSFLLLLSLQESVWTKRQALLFWAKSGSLFESPSTIKHFFNKTQFNRVKITNTTTCAREKCGRLQTTLSQPTVSFSNFVM